MKPQPELLTATLLAPEGEQAESRTRDVLFYSGAKVKRYDWWNDEEYFLSFDMDSAKLDRLNDGAPVFKDHVPTLNSTVGITSNARIEKGKGYATLRFSEREDVEGLWQDIQGGIINSVSMGVSIGYLEDVTPKKVKDAMKEYLAHDWEPFEISVVPIGADPKARMLAAQFMSDQYFARKNESAPVPFPLLSAQALNEALTEQQQPNTKPLTPQDEARVKLALALNLHTRERNLRRTR